jgi:hypothetical protein
MNQNTESKHDVGAEIMAGDSLSASQAAKIIPHSRLNKPLSPQTVVRWIVSGIKNHDGQRLRLEGKRLGGSWFTSRAAILRWMERQTPDLADEEGATAQPKGNAAAERAGKELEQIGA